jgi:hypothetical protein
MGKIAVKLGDNSQKVGKDFGRCEFVIADLNSSQPIPMTAADFGVVAVGVALIELEDGSGFLELEDGSGFVELEA